MIVVDSSAFVAVFWRESDASLYLAEMLKADRIAVSAMIVFETRTVLGHGRSAPAVDAFNAWLVEAAADIRPFDAAMADAAFAAYSRYGKGVHSKARLNLSDCAAYALAKALDAPLLFKGADFRHTDVTPAL